LLLLAIGLVCKSFGVKKTVDLFFKIDEGCAKAFGFVICPGTRVDIADFHHRLLHKRQNGSGVA
jgi:hypothetical protein